MPVQTNLSGELAAVPRAGGGYDLCIRASADHVYVLPLDAAAARGLARELGGGLAIVSANGVPGLRP